MNPPGYYILDENHQPVKCTMLEFAAFKTPEKISLWCVEKTVIGDAEISTVFLGIDHRFWDDGPPILFETMIFGGEHDGEMDRYSTWDQAKNGHKRWVWRLRGAEATGS